jgi:acyl carrier protein
MPAELTELKPRLKEFLLTQLLRRPSYPLRDDERLISGGLIDSFSLAQIAVFVEEAFGVYIPDTELTVDNMDTLDQMVTQVIHWQANGG